MIATLSLVLVAAQPTTSACAAAARTYSEAIYPLSAEQKRRASEVNYTPTDDFGYNEPFPAVERQPFVVDDYGAVGDGVTDCTPAFYAALADAMAFDGAAEVVLRSRGHYLLRPDTEAGSDELAILNVRDAGNLVIRGQGLDTVLVMGHPSLGGLCVTGGRMVMVRDLSIDYNPLPFTQGTVIGVNPDEGRFTLAVDEGYPTPGEICKLIPPGWHGGYRMSKSADGAYRWPPITPLVISSVEEADDGNWRLNADAEKLAGYLKAGDEFIYVGRRLAQQALTGARTTGFYVNNVCVHASPTCGLGIWETDGVHVDGYADTAPAGSNRMLASNADGLYCHGARGGITVGNCYFMGQGDDCINLHCPAFAGQHVRLNGPSDITIETDTDIRTIDTLEIMDPTVGLIKGQVKVLEAQRAEDGQMVRLWLDRPLDAIGYVHDVDYIYPASLAAPNFRIAHNYFGQNRSRCLLIQARNGLIEANTFENAEGYGIVMGYGGTAWAEGVIPSDVTVRDNVFRNVTNVGLAPAIQVGDGSDHRNFRNLQILGNRFINVRKMAIQLVGVDGAQIVDNTVESQAGRRNTWNHPEWFPVDCSLYLDNCTGVELDRLAVDDPGLLEAAIYIGPACDAGEAGVRIGEVTGDIPEGVPLVRDVR